MTKVDKQNNELARSEPFPDALRLMPDLHERGKRMTKRFLTRKEIVREYGISVSTLAHWSQAGKGPPFSVVGRTSFYPREGLERLFEDTKVDLKKRALARAPKRPIGRPRKNRPRSIARQLASATIDPVQHGRLDPAANGHKKEG